MLRLRIYKLADNDLKEELELADQAAVDAYIAERIAKPHVWIKDERTILDGEGNVVEVLPKTYRVEIEDISYEFQLRECYAARRKEYPPITDLADALAKDDAEALQAYKDACLEVKKKYPKPEAP